MTHLYLHINLFLKARFSPVFRCFTLLKLNYLYLLIIINYPRFIRCVIANQLTGFYMPLCFTVKGTSDNMRDFDFPSFQFYWKSQICLIDFSFLALKWLYATDVKCLTS